MKEILKTLIREFHTGKLPRPLKRETVLPLNTEKIITVTGPRRAGKTYLLFQHILELIEKGIPAEKILYINFEDERLDFELKTLDLILQSYRELYPELSLDKCYFFFDEIQNIKGWERFIRRIYDSVSKNIFITGSNSRLLGEEIASSLRGRTIRFEVFPLNFREFIRFKNFDFDPERDFFSSEKKARLMKIFNEYMIFGGFPEVVFLEESLKVKTLQEYFEVMLYRDIAERYHIKDILLLKYFLKRLAENAGRFFSVHKIYNELKSQGLKLGKDMLYKYLDYAEASYVVRLVKKHYRSVTKTELGEKKIYLIDTGLLNSIKFFEKKDYGVLLENLVFRELSSVAKNVLSFKEKKECDFLVDNKIAIQVSFDITEPTTLKREISGLKKACKYLNLKKGYIITYDNKGEVKENSINISIFPAYELLITADWLA